MAMRYFNWKLAIVLVVASVVFGFSVYALHHWQTTQRARQALPRGLKAFDAKKWDEAAEQLGLYIASNNQDISALVKYGDAQLKRLPRTKGNFQQAIAAYRNVLRFRPSDIDTAKKLVELYVKGGSPDEAKEIATRSLSVQDEPGLRRLLAMALWQLRKFDEAAAELKSVLAKHPDEVLAYEFMGRYVANTKPELAGLPAVAWFDEAVAKNPQSALAYAVRAEYHLGEGDKTKALADLTRALACDLSDASVRQRLIDDLIAADALDKAREQLQALQEIDDTDPTLWNLWAKLAIKTKSAEEMFTVAEQGMKATGESLDFIATATTLLVFSDHLEKVDGYLARMRDKDLDPARQAYLEGLLMEKQGRLRDAVACWQRAVSLPSNLRVEMCWRLASAYSQLGDIQSAINQLQMMLAQRSSEKGDAIYVDAQLFLARLYAQDRDWDKVRNTVRQIRQVVPEGSQILKEATLLDLQAWTHELAADRSNADKEPVWQEIEAQLAKLSEDTDSAAGVKLLQVQIAMMRGKYADASAVLDALESKNPSDIRLMLVRAELCIAQGQNDQARALYEKAIAAAPQAFDPVRGFATFLDRQGQRAECESLLKGAIARFNAPQLRLNCSLTLADLYLRWGEKEKSSLWLTALTAEFPTDIQSRRMLLTCEPMIQDPSRSQKIIDEIKALEGDGGSQWRFEQARLWLRSGDDFKKLHYPQVVKILQENLLNNPDDQNSRLLLATAYAMAGEQQLALKVYREAHDRAPNDTQVLARLVAALHSANEFDEAQKLLDEAGQLQLSDPYLQRLQLDIDLNRNDIDSASDALERLVEQDPNDATLKLLYARVLVLRKESAKAEALLTELKAKFPDSIPVIRAQIRFYVQQGNMDKAMQICNEAVERIHSAVAYLVRAEMFDNLRQEAKALEDYGQAIAVEPRNHIAWQARARFYSRSGRIPEAVADIRQALALVPDEPEGQKLAVQKLAITVFIASDKPSLLQEAEAMLDKILNDADNAKKKYPEFYVAKARILIRRDTGPAVEEARRLLRQVTTDFPKYMEGWVLMAQLELSKDEAGKALDIATRGLAHSEAKPEDGDSPYKQLLLLKAVAEKRLSPAVAALTTLPKLAEDYPGDVGILIEWADAYARSNNAGKAVDLLRSKKGSFTGPALRRCEIALAAALYADKQRDQAAELFDTLIAADPNDPTPVMTLGQLLRKEKRWTEVNQLLNRWRTTNPKDAETATSMARILAGSGDREALQMAEDQLRMILDENPKAIPTLVLLGMLMQDAGRNEEATRLNRQILEMDPNNVIAINNLAWMLCEQASPSPEAMKEAMDLANRGVKLAPDYVDLLDTRAVVYYRTGDMAKAEADLVKCLSLFPDNSPQSAAPQFHLARTYAAMNRRTQSLEHLKIALRLNRYNVQLARSHADAGRRTHAIKVLRDALSLQEEMDRFKTGFDPQDLVDVRPGQDWTEAKLLLDQLQKGR